MALKRHKVGRPLKFRTPRELANKIEAYFEARRQLDDKGNWDGISYIHLGVTDLACWLNVDRVTILDYENKNDKFSLPIKEAKSRIEAWLELQLQKNPRTAGVIFTMVNNQGWANKIEQQNDNTYTIKVNNYAHARIEPPKVEPIVLDAPDI